MAEVEARGPRCQGVRRSDGQERVKGQNVLVGRGSFPGIVEGGVPALGRPRRSVSDGINPIGSIAADGEYSIRWGRFHPIRRVLNLPDRVFRLIGNKRRFEAWLCPDATPVAYPQPTRFAL